MTMSKRRRRRRRTNSLRRKSSRCTKQTQSQCTSQCQSQSSNCNSARYKNDQLEKGGRDSLWRESFCADADGGEDRMRHEAGSKENRFRVNSSERAFWDDRKSPSSEVEEAADDGVRITTSVRIDDCEVSSRIVFQNSREFSSVDKAHRSVSVSTTEVTYSRSEAEVEINEVVHSDNSDVKTTIVVRDRNRRGKGAGVKSRWGNRDTPKKEKLNQPCSVSHNLTASPYELHRQCKNKSHKLSISGTNTDLSEVAKSQVQSSGQEEIACGKSCCEEGMNNRLLKERFSSLSSLSDTCIQETEQPLTNTRSCEATSDALPPHEFANILLDGLTENMASCQISSRDNFNHQVGGSASIALAVPCDSSDKPESAGYASREAENHRDGIGFFECISGPDTNDSLFLDCGIPVSRSSYTKEFVHNHEGKKRLRNNSIAILETKPRVARYFERLVKRRQTFPGPTGSQNKMEEGALLCRESFSSDMLSPFFMQCLPLQVERLGWCLMDDERSSLLSAESRKSSEGQTGCKVSSCNVTGDRTFLSDTSTNGNVRNLSRAEEIQEEVFSAGQHTQHKQMRNEVTMSVRAAASLCGDLFTDVADYGSEQLEQSEVTESGFDEEMTEVEEQYPEFLANNLIFKPQDLLIQVTPPSLSSSEERIVEDSSQSNMLREGVANPKPQPRKTAASPDCPSNKRKGSVMTSIIGGHEQRSIQTVTKPLEMTFPERNQDELSSAVLGATSSSSAKDMEEKELDSNSNETKSIPRRSFIAESNDSIQTFVQGHEMMEASRSSTEFGPPSPTDASRGKTVTDTNGSSPGFPDCGITDSEPKLLQTGSGIPRCLTDMKTEEKENLRPPVELALKEQEEVLDHWARRRKLFKDSKQWSSAGGNSLTSSITEESVNSDDGRSVDMSVRDIEDRGFYTETFHSASWIYRGDHIHPTDSPHCLSKRPPPVTIRERTVRISKGMGDYPWGFRIQCSKPIVVTEVDTNGAAEEAGLLVGDAVLSVNGTDVTSVSHSEAAELAKQGPDILTLTIGSDISRYPSTPRPACRGYLHKRTQSGLLKGWRKRWFVLKHDGCLYYYRHKRDEGKTCALSAMKIEGAEVGPDTSLGKPFVFKCRPASCTRVYYFCATSNQEMKRWLEAVDQAIHPTPQNHVWMDVARHNSSLPPLAIKSPECLGLLHQLDKSKDLWVQHYCILKDGCLYFYPGIRSTHSTGGIFLHGYTVQEQTAGSRRSIIELKPPSEEFKSFSLCAENATETNRWMLAMKASINKWVLLHQAIEDYMNRPAEETRM